MITNFQKNRRCGFAVVLVLGMLCMVLAVSYALVRDQGNSAIIQSNLDLRAAAEQAATAGITAAMTEMHEADWSGVTSTVQRTLSTSASYTVTYATGDAELTVGDSEYEEFPFRVTITSVGTAVDPADSSRVVTHTATAVVQLQRRALTDPPSNWLVVKNYSLWQWGNRLNLLQFPSRVEGIQYYAGEVRLTEEYPGNSTVDQAYMSGLGTLDSTYLKDYRPLNDGPVLLEEAKQSSSTLSHVSSLGVWTFNFATNSYYSPLGLPSNLMYQLFPGGTVYSAERIDATSTISNATFEPDAETNPLGWFYFDQDAEIGNNVVIKGSLFSPRVIEFSGTSISMETPTLPAWEGSTEETLLPSLVTIEDVEVLAGAQVTWNGFVYTTEELNVDGGTAGNLTRCRLNGGLTCQEFDLHGRADWQLTSTQWVQLYNDYQSWKNSFEGILLASLFVVNTFPQYVWRRKGWSAEPNVVVKNETVSHWPNWTEPIYKPADSDTGLRWDIVRIDLAP